MFPLYILRASHSYVCSSRPRCNLTCVYDRCTCVGVPCKPQVFKGRASPGSPGCGTLLVFHDKHLLNGWPKGWMTEGEKVMTSRNQGSVRSSWALWFCPLCIYCLSLCAGCHHPIPRTKGLGNSWNILAPVLEVGNPRSRCRVVGFWWGTVLGYELLTSFVLTWQKGLGNSLWSNSNSDDSPLMT